MGLKPQNMARVQPLLLQAAFGFRTCLTISRGCKLPSNTVPPPDMMTILMRRAYVGAAAVILGSVATVSAQEPLMPAGCPAVSVQRSTVRTGGAVTAERTASTTLVGEGRAATRTVSGESVAKAMSLYEQAVRADPTNAGAYVLLARMHAQSQRYLSVPKKLARARTWENLSKAQALDPSNIDGLHLLADHVMANNGDYRCARTILEAALTLDPRKHDPIISTRSY